MPLGRAAWIGLVGSLAAFGWSSPGCAGRGRPAPRAAAAEEPAPPSGLDGLGPWEVVAAPRAEPILPRAEAARGACTSAADAAGREVAPAPDGGLVLLGVFCGTADLDPGPGVELASSAGEQDVFVVRLGPSRELLWARTLGGPLDDEPLGLATAPDGAVVVAALLRGEPDVDPGPAVDLRAAGEGGRTAVVRLGADGSTEWARLFEGPSELTVAGLALSTDGSTIVAGAFEGTVDVDPGPAVATRTARGGPDAALLWLDREGRLLRDRVLSGFGDEAARAVALAPDGSVRVAGVFSSIIDLDPAETDLVTGAGQDRQVSSGRGDVFVASLDPEGRALWGRRLGGAGDESVEGLVALESGALLVAGRFEGVADLDPGPGARLASAGSGRGLYVVALDPGGGFVWAGARPEAEDAAAPGLGHRLAVGPGGTASLVTDDGVIAFEAGSGAERWSRGLGPRGDEELSFGEPLCWPGEVETAGVAVLPDGRTLVTGSLEGGTTLDGCSPWLRDARVGLDGFLLELDAGGAPGRTLAWGEELMRVRAVAVGADGSTTLAGAFSGTVDLDPGPGVATRTSRGGPDGFVLRLDRSGRLRWLRTLGGEASDGVVDLLVGRDGAVVAAGYAEGRLELDPGSPVVLDEAAAPAFLLGLSPTGRPRWAFRVGPGSSPLPLRLALGPAGEPTLVGVLDREADLDPTVGELVRAPEGDADLFVTRLGQDGAFASSRTVPGVETYLEAPGELEVRVSRRGDLALVALADDADDQGWLAAAFAPDGRPLWSRSLVAVDALELLVGDDGTTALVGAFDLAEAGAREGDRADAGREAAPDDDEEEASDEVRVLAFAPSGEPRLDRHLRSGTDPAALLLASRVGLAPDGAVALVGSFDGTLVAGPAEGEVVSFADRGLVGLFVDRLEAEAGWVRLLAAEEVSDEAALVTRSGSVLLAARFGGRLRLDPQVSDEGPDAAGDSDLCLVAFDRAGARRWVETFPAATTAFLERDGGAFVLGPLADDGGQPGDEGGETGPVGLAVTRVSAEGRRLWAASFGRGRAALVGAASRGSASLLALAFEGPVDGDPGPAVAPRETPGEGALLLASLDGRGALVWSSLAALPGPRSEGGDEPALPVFRSPDAEAVADLGVAAWPLWVGERLFVPPEEPTEPCDGATPPCGEPGPAGPGRSEGWERAPRGLLLVPESPAPEEAPPGAIPFRDLARGCEPGSCGTAPEPPALGLPPTPLALERAPTWQEMRAREALHERPSVEGLGALRPSGRAPEVRGRVDGPVTAWPSPGPGGSVDRRDVLAVLPAVRGCYESFLTAGGHGEGRVVVGWTIAEDGSASGVHLESATLPDLALQDCVLEVVRTFPFPRPTGGPAEITLPLLFLPAE